MSEQRFELAAQKFAAALKEQPDDKATKQQLALAKNGLNEWSKRLLISADQARLANQDGKALLLYAKVFKITQSSAANEHYKTLYRQLREQSLVSVNLLPNSAGIDSMLVESVDGIQLNDNKHAIDLKFAQSNPIFEIQQSTVTLETQYISGTQLVANSQLLDLQHALSQTQHRERSISRESRSLRRSLSGLKNRLSQQEQKKQRAQNQLLASNLSDNQRQQLNQTLNEAQNRVSSLEQQVRTVNSSIRSFRNQTRDLSHHVNELAHQLAHTPATIDVPVYSDYQYPVNQQTNSLTATLYMLIGQQTRPAKITVDSTDQSHPAHPTINLVANPMQVDNKAVLMPLLDQERPSTARRLLSEYIDERKLGFYYLSQKALDIDQQFTLLVKHGLVTRQGATNEVADKIKQRLVLDFGVAGEFNVNELLHLYQ